MALTAGKYRGIAWEVRRTADRSETVCRRYTPDSLSVRSTCLPPEASIERARGAASCSTRLRCSRKSVVKRIRLSRALTSGLQGNNKFNRFIMPRAPIPLPPPAATKLCRSEWLVFAPHKNKTDMPPSTPRPPQPPNPTLGDPIHNWGAASTALLQAACLKATFRVI
jgi:hypothetical protein